MDGLDTPLEVDTKIANALLGLATEAFVAAQLASRDASIAALQGAKADATLLASYATNAALSASETTLQSALDAILAELAALQLSGSGGVVNAPAWAGFTTWELVRGSNVVRNLHFVASLSAALANGDDTLSITADCYSTAGTDAAITAALLAYYTSSQVDTVLGHHSGAAYYTAAQVDALLGDYRTASAQDADAGRHRGRAVGLPDGPGPGRLHNQPNHLGAGAYRSAADQDTATTSSIAAALLSYYTIAQVDRLLAGKLGVTEAASALQIAVRFPDDGGADEVVAAIGEQILGPTDVSLSNWTVRPSSGCSWSWPRTPRAQCGRLHTDPGGEPVEHRAHLQLDPGPRAPRRLPLPPRHSLQLRGVHVRPIVRQLRGRPGCLKHAKMYFTVPPNGVAKLHFGAPGLPNQTAGTVDVYGLQILDATLETGNAAEAEEDMAASALLLKHEFLDGGRWPPWARCCWSPAFGLVLRRIRSLKRCVEACGCKIMTPRYACNLAPGCISSEPTFAGLRKNKKKKRKQGVPKKGVRKKGKRGFLWQSLTSLEMQPGAKLRRISRGHYFAATRLHAAF